MYQKEIIYMGLHKDGSRVGSAGFLKAEMRDKTGALTMSVKNIPRSIEGRFPVRYCLGAVREEQTVETDDGGLTEHEEWREEDGITLRDGGGVWEKKELEASEWIRVQILLPNGYLVEGESKAAGKQTRPKVGALPAEPADSTPRRSVFVQRDIPVMEPNDSAPGEPVTAQKDVPAAEPIVSASHESVPVIAAPQRDAAVEPTVAAPSQPIMPGRPPLMADALAIEGLKEDKWEQILASYDRIHPYGDSRVYVKIAPKDFIILSSSCQHLVNNSFLLHGFYNYRYVILGRGELSPREVSSEGYAASASEAEDYLLGVPGVFYEREKMVALMFGFEAFECEGGDPKPGDFGYYLRKVEL